MNFPWASFSIILILLHVQKTSGAEPQVNRYESSAPLVLIEESQPPELKFATPKRAGKHKSVAAYPYNNDSENGPVQKFITACPAYTDEQKGIENQWRSQANASKESRLFFFKQYTGYDMICPVRDRPGPSIQNTKTPCGKSEGEIYEVGYPVYNEDKQEIQFMAVYEICYSKIEGNGIIYTKHRIDSPSLMLLYVHNFHFPKAYMFFLSILDPENLKKLEKFYNKQGEYIYPFVPKFDMPSKLWENTTLFPFNHTPIGHDKNMNTHLMKYDNFVRLFSQEEDTPLIIYSGTYQTTILEHGVSRFRRRKIETPVPINSFWRVIIDKENKATILITQYTKKKCGVETSYICDENSVQPIEDYKHGGCTYQCPLTPALINTLRLPEINFQEHLVLKYTKTVEPKSETTQGAVGGQSDADAESSSTQVSITDCAGSATFVAAVMVFDSAVATAMQSDGAIDAGNGLSNSDGATEGGGDHGGNNDGAGEGGPGDGG